MVEHFTQYNSLYLILKWFLKCNNNVTILSNGKKLNSYSIRFYVWHRLDYPSEFFYQFSSCCISLMYSQKLHRLHELLLGVEIVIIKANFDGDYAVKNLCLRWDSNARPSDLETRTEPSNESFEVNVWGRRPRIPRIKQTRLTSESESRSSAIAEEGGADLVSINFLRQQIPANKRMRRKLRRNARIKIWVCGKDFTAIDGPYVKYKETLGLREFELLS